MQIVRDVFFLRLLPICLPLPPILDCTTIDRWCLFCYCCCCCCYYSNFSINKIYTYIYVTAREESRRKTLQKLRETQLCFSRQFRVDFAIQSLFVAIVSAAYFVYRMNVEMIRMNHTQQQQKISLTTQME